MSGLTSFVLDQAFLEFVSRHFGSLWFGMFVIQDCPRCVEIALATRDLHMNLSRIFCNIFLRLIHQNSLSLYLGTLLFWISK